MPTDEELLSRIPDGDNHAFAELVRRHSKKFYALSYRYLENREEAEDMVQAAFLKLWEKPDMWQDGKGAKFTTWFYRIVVNMCLDIKKKHKTLPMEEDFDVSDERDNQEEKALKQQARKVLKYNLDQLPKRQKTALILCSYEQMSHKEAANVMKLSEKALQSLLMRAKTTLKEKMKGYL